MLGPLKLHIILVFIIFSSRAIAQGLFVSVCLFCPSTPTPPLHSTEHIWHWASSLAVDHQCVNGSLFPLRLSLWFSFGQERLLAEVDVCHPHENCFLLFLTAHFALATHSRSSFCSSGVTLTEHILKVEVFF